MMSHQDRPLVSWIVPVYNTASYLPQCLDSVIAQTYRHWELLLMDDGSTDGSAAICDQYAAKEERIRVVHKPNTGKPDTLNKAIGMAQGDYVGVIDSDDWLEPEMCEVLLQAMQQTGREAAGCGYRNEFVGETVLDAVCQERQVLNSTEAIVLLCDRKLYGYLHGRLYRRQLLVEPVPPLRRYEDFAVLYQWLSHGNGMTLVPECLYHYRQRRSSIMNSGSDHMLGYVPLLAACYRLLKAQQLLPDEENQRLLVKNSIRIAKDIAREEGDEAVAHVTAIRDTLLQQNLSPHTRRYGLKLRWRQWLLNKSVTAFIAVMRLGHKRGHADHFEYFK